MASMTFMPYVDKENTGSLGIHSGKGQQRSSTGLGGGKLFSSNPQKSLVTPRRALGDVSNVRSQSLKAQKHAFKPPASQERKGLKLHGTKQGQQLQMRSIAKEKNIPVEPHYDDIEHMHIPKDMQDDDFEDIWPKSERISTYISQLISWRPPCLFADYPASDDEVDEEEERRKRMEDLSNILDTMPEPPTFVDDVPELDEDILWIPEPLEDVPFPSSDELFDVSQPLDDTLDILASVGPLRIHDTP